MLRRSLRGRAAGATSAYKLELLHADQNRDTDRDQRGDGNDQIRARAFGIIVGRFLFHAARGFPVMFVGDAPDLLLGLLPQGAFRSNVQRLCGKPEQPH